MYTTTLSRFLAGAGGRCVKPIPLGFLDCGPPEIRAIFKHAEHVADVTKKRLRQLLLSQASKIDEKKIVIDVVELATTIGARPYELTGFDAACRPV